MYIYVIFILGVVRILIERSDEIGNVPVSILNLSKTLQEGSKSLPKGHYYPRRTDSMSGLIRDTWSKLRGRNSGREDGGQLLYVHVVQQVSIPLTPISSYLYVGRSVLSLIIY